MEIKPDLKLELRKVDMSDLPLFLSFEAAVARYLDGSKWPKSEETLRSWLARECIPKLGDSARWVAVEHMSGQSVGTIDTYACDRQHGTFKYGLAVASVHRRKGVAKEMIVQLLDHYFNKLNYQKVTPHIYCFNEPSIRLHEKLGFSLEGRLRSMLREGDIYYDELHYGMTREEYNTAHRE